MKTHQTVILLFACLACLAACKKESYSSEYLQDAASVEGVAAMENRYCPHIDPADFVKVVDNPYLPYKPGTVFHYVNKITENNHITTEHTTTTVTDDTKLILGVHCTVVHDVVRVEGKITEDTYDWYAQDKHGTVWYFGEDTKARTRHGWSTEGSWEAGIDGAKPGIIMYGNPQAHIGETYRQEYLKGVAEDQGKLVNTNSSVTVAYGTFNNCVKTAEFTVLEPGIIEHKYYAYGVGQVLTTLTKGGEEREELISITY